MRRSKGKAKKKMMQILFAEIARKKKEKNSHIEYFIFTPKPETHSMK